MRYSVLLLNNVTDYCAEWCFNLHFMTARRATTSEPAAASAAFELSSDLGDFLFHLEMKLASRVATLEANIAQNLAYLVGVVN